MPSTDLHAPPPTDGPVDVLIAGAGPVGLMLALELNRHGVRTLLIERNKGTTTYPKMDITNGRSMELFRRLGLSEEVRRHAVPMESPFAVVWATALAGRALARFDYPTAAEAWREWRRENDGSKPVEPMMRISQVELEPVLRDILLRDAREHVTVRYGWRLDDFEANADGVTATLAQSEGGRQLQLRARYLVGCDGGGSRVRRKLGYALDEIPVVEVLREAGGAWRSLLAAGRGLLRGRRPPDGRAYIIHFRSSDTEALQHFGVTWHTQFMNGATLIAQNDHDIWTLHVPLRGENVDKIDPRDLLRRTLGRDVDAEILISSHWRPRLAVADRFGEGRVWLAGDAVRQVIPTGAYGMNTGVGDALDLGWKLGAVLQGWGGPNLLASYEKERRPIALRNRAASKRHTAVRVRIGNLDSAALCGERPRHARRRKAVGDRIQALGNLENEALGIEIGYRYRGSPVICETKAGAAEPKDRWDVYTPTTWPGARPPSVFLPDGSNIFDYFTNGFTLLRFAEHDVGPLARAAAAKGVPLTVVDIRDDTARRLYERDLVLIRPDQHVCWRGAGPPDEPSAVVDTIRGA